MSRIFYSSSLRIWNHTIAICLYDINSNPATNHTTRLQPDNEETTHHMLLLLFGLSPSHQWMWLSKPLRCLLHVCTAEVQRACGAVVHVRLHIYRDVSLPHTGTVIKFNLCLKSCSYLSVYCKVHIAVIYLSDLLPIQNLCKRKWCLTIWIHASVPLHTKWSWGIKRGIKSGDPTLLDEEICCYKLRM